MPRQLCGNVKYFFVHTSLNRVISDLLLFPWNLVPDRVKYSWNRENARMETFWRHSRIASTGESAKYLIVGAGEVTERLKVHDWKSCVRLTPYRGFESLPLRQYLAC